MVSSGLQHASGQDTPTIERHPPSSCIRSILVLVIMLLGTAMILALGLITYLIIITLLPVLSPAVSNIYPILKGDVINIPIPTSGTLPSYIDISLIGHVSSTCQVSITVTSDVQYTTPEVLVDSGSFDNKYLAQGSIITVDPEDVEIDGILDVWLFSNYMDLLDAMEDGFDHISNPRKQHECYFHALCGSVGKFSSDDLLLNITESSYYSMRCVDGYPYNCSSLRKWTVEKVSYVTNTTSAISNNNIRVNDDATRISLDGNDSQKPLFVLALLNDNSCDDSHQHFLVTAYPDLDDTAVHHYITMGLVATIKVLCMISIALLLCIIFYHHRCSKQAADKSEQTEHPLEET